MSDTYRELLVKREPQPSDKLLKAGLIVLTVLAAAAVVLITPWAAVVLLGLCLFNYFKFPSFRLEFEYLYVNGELDVDKIMSRSTRKRAGSYDMEMDYYRNGQKEKVTDFSSGRKDADIYAMVYGSEKGTEIILFEPDEAILQDIQRIAPRKVHIGK